MTQTYPQGEYAPALDAAQRRAIHELRGEPGDDGWRAAGLLAAAYVVSRVGPLLNTSTDNNIWQPTGDETLCFFPDLLEQGGSACVLLPRAELAALSPDGLTERLKQIAHAMLSAARAREAAAARLPSSAAG